MTGNDPDRWRDWVVIAILAATLLAVIFAVMPLMNRQTY